MKHVSRDATISKPIQTQICEPRVMNSFDRINEEEEKKKNKEILMYMNSLKTRISFCSFHFYSQWWNQILRPNS